MSTTPNLVEALAISKHFGGAQALQSVDLAVVAGEVHCLVGENGAGKSTMGKIMAGVVQPDGGSLRVDGRDVEYQSPRDALSDGITIVEQELALVPAMTVVENVLLGLSPAEIAPDSASRFASRSSGRRYVRDLVDQYDLGLDIDRPVERLPIAEQQKVEILRALARRARLIVMDEPTARLAGAEAKNLLDIVRRLAGGGTAIVYVSHFLEEVLEIADRLTVLRNGRLVKTVPAEGETPRSLVAAMLGRDAELAFPPKRPVADTEEPVLTIRGLSGGTSVPVDDVSFEIRPGEILGLAGLVGAGRTEVARMIFGADRVKAGEVQMAGQPARRSTSARAAIADGISYLPENRKDLGLFMVKSVQDNVTLSALSRVSRWGVLQSGQERNATKGILERLAVQPADPELPVGTLSGGNQQKVLFGKWLWHGPRVLIADEPTRGVDVGAKFAIYELVAELANQGLAILLISSEMEELVGLAHRVVVLSRGRQVAMLEGDEVRGDNILEAAFGQVA